MKHTLEGYKLFPMVAWITVIGFALFTLHLTLVVSDKIAKIGQSDIVYAPQISITE